MGRPLLQNLAKRSLKDRAWLNSESYPHEPCLLPDLSASSSVSEAGIQDPMHWLTTQIHSMRNIMQPQQKYNTLWRHYWQWPNEPLGTNRGWGKVSQRPIGNYPPGQTQESQSCGIKHRPGSNSLNFTFIHNFAELALGQGEEFFWRFLGNFGSADEIFFFLLKALLIRVIPKKWSWNVFSLWYNGRSLLWYTCQW